MTILRMLAGVMALGLGTVASQSAPPPPPEEPGWLGIIIARGELKDRIESTPILERPYRPLHVYGNTMRRNHYRGAPVPKLKDVVRGAGSIVTNR